MADALAPPNGLTERQRLFWPWVYDIRFDAYFHAGTGAKADVLDIEFDHVLYRGRKRA